MNLLIVWSLAKEVYSLPVKVLLEILDFFCPIPKLIYKYKSVVYNIVNTEINSINLVVLSLTDPTHLSDIFKMEDKPEPFICINQHKHAQVEEDNYF